MARLTKCVIYLAGIALSLAGCGNTAASKVAVMADTGAASGGDVAGGQASAGETSAADANANETGADTATAPTFPPQPCDGLIAAACALPWPSNLYLKPDASRKTGYTLSFGDASLPGGQGMGKAISPADYTLLDGYSVGSSLLLLWPDLDVANLASEASISQSLDATAPVVILEVTSTGKVVRKIPYWAELDATEDDATKKTLMIRPALTLLPATRYVIGVRNLKDTKGKLIEPTLAFKNLVAGTTAGSPDASRQARFDDLLGVLTKEAWSKDSLIVAWDFVTNSEEALHGRLLKMREESYKAMDSTAQALKITTVKTFTEAENAEIAVQLDGVFTVPNWLSPPAEDTRKLVLDKQGLPIQQGSIDRPFEVRIPRSALKGEPHGLLQYGHGLNGSYAEVNAGYNGSIANTHKLILYSCYWTGMSELDVASIIGTIVNMDNFRVMADKLHQGMIDQLMLQRAMRDQFANLPEVKKLGIVVNNKEMFYSGISQGGIYGGTILALSKDVERGHLGVPGNNYAMLLQRSVDFDGFFVIVAGEYPKSVNQQILLMTIQLLWDAVDPITWYRHIEMDPLPGNSKHQVLIVPAKGDWQVAVVTNEIAARSNFGFPIMANYGKPVFGVTEKAYPYVGSGIVLYDHGNPWPGLGNVPPNDKVGDPHGKPRKLAHHQEQMVHFLRTGEIKDVCGGDGCTPQ